MRSASVGRVRSSGREAGVPKLRSGVQIWHNSFAHISGIGGVFYDITNKPPGTIEWE